MKKSKALALNTLVLTATAVFINAAHMSFNVYISNKAGAEIMGIYQLIMSVFMLAATVAVSGIGLASTRLVAEDLGFGREGGIKSAVKKCMAYALCTGLASCFLLAVFAGLIGEKWLKNEFTVQPIYFLALSMPFISISSVISGYFTAVRRVLKSASAQIFELSVRVAVASYTLNLLLPKGAQYACFAPVLGITVSEAAAFFFQFILYVHDVKKYNDRMPQKTASPPLRGKSAAGGITQRMLSISVPLALSSYLRSAFGTVRQIITPLNLEKSGISKQSALAGYGIIRGMAMPVIMFPSGLLYAFGSLLMPEVTRFYASKNYAAINDTISRVFKLALLFAICVAGILYGFSAELGEALYKSADASGYIKILSLLAPVMYFDGITDAFLKGLDRQAGVVKINVAEAAAAVCLTPALLPAFGINGYLAVIYIGEILNAALSIWLLVKTAKFKFLFLDWMLKPIFSAFVAVIFSKLVYINIFFNIALAAAVYGAVSYALGNIKKGDFDILKHTALY